MNRSEWKEFVKSKIVILDGATGSNLQKRGMPSGVCPEQWILEHPDVLVLLQKEYLMAGSDILFAPTFSGNRFKLSEYGLGGKVDEMNRALVAVSKRAAEEYARETGTGRRVLIAGDMTLTGKQLPPMGMTDFEDLVDGYKEQAKSLCAAGADLIIIETMMSLQECRAALLAVKETCELPVMVTLTFNDDLHTLYGTDPETAVLVLQSMGADAVGVNCSAGPDKMLGVIERMKRIAAVPLIAKPNAGLPRLEGGITVFDMGPEEFARGMEQMIEAGAAIVGGCCGTTPDHIRSLAAAAEGKEPYIPEARHIRAISTERRTLKIRTDERVYLIGERINPTGKPELQEELRDGDTDMVSDMAEEQEETGADILDINVGMSGIDEKETMLEVLEAVQMASSLPLCIDTSRADVMEAALRRYPGRALLNSISMEEKKLKLLPAAKKYGAMFILLPLSDRGMPKDEEEKRQNIKSVIERAAEYGLTGEDIVVDCLVNPIGANGQAGVSALQTIRWCKEQGLAVTAGLSNISFGLPERQFVNSTFLAMAISSGLTMAIANPSQEMLKITAMAADMLCGRENAGVRYIETVTAKSQLLSAGKIPEGRTEAHTAGKADKEEGDDDGEGHRRGCEPGKEGGAREKGSPEPEWPDHPLYLAVLKGNRKGASAIAEEAVKTVAAGTLMNRCLIPAINEVGVLFDRGTYFLPQLIASAEAMKSAIDIVSPLLSDRENTAAAGTIVAATVAGDIHDIGKNLVVLMLKNYGFRVIDLGKDVSSETIIEEAEKADADIIAVSALMTTTMQVMREIVTLRNESGIRARIMIGGAVITQGFADEIGADGYSENAREAVKLAQRLTAADGKQDEEVEPC